MSNPLSFLQELEFYISEFGEPAIWLILALPFLAIFFSIVIPFLVRGIKQGLYQALVSLGSTVVALIGSVLLSQILAMMLSNLLFEKILSSLGDKVAFLSGALSQFLTDGTYLGALLQWVISALLATLLFVILFIVLLAVCKVVICKTVKPFTEKMDKPAFNGGGGLLIRIVDAVLVAFLFIAPVYSVLGYGMTTLEDTALGIVDIHQQQTEETTPFAEDSYDSPLSENILAITTPFTDCPFVKVAKLPGLNFGKSVFGTFMYDGKLYNAYDIFNQSTDVLVLSLNLSDKKMSEYGQTEVDALKNVLEAANQNDFFYGVFSDVFRLAATIVSENYENATALGGDTSKLELLVTILAPFETCSAEDVMGCANSLVSLFESAIKNDVLNGSEKPEMLFKSLAEGTFLDEAIPTLRQSELLSRTVDNLLLVALNYLNFSSESEEAGQFESTIEQLKNRMKDSILAGHTDPEKEVYAFKTVFGGFAELHESTNGFKDFSFESISSKGIADLLTGLGSHPHIGKQGAEDLINAALPSFGANATILTDDFIKAATNALVSDIENPPAKGSQGKFENLIFTAQHLTSAITNGFGDGKDKEKLNNTIDMLLSDMTPESAETVTTVLTKDVMDTINKNGATTGNTEGFVKDLITNMASYDAESKEELEKEREAIIKMNDLVLDAENKLNNKPADQTAIEAAVGGDLKGFVSDVSSSTVLMGTVNDTFEKNPDKTEDPTGMFSSMGAEDKEKLNSVCLEMLEDDSVSAQQKENIKKLCRFMGGSIN